MKKYYTRACNFYYGSISKEKIKKKQSLPLKGNSLIYFDTIGFFLSLLSKLFISNYKKNFDKKIKFWDSMIWLSRIIDFISFRSLGKSLLVIIKK